LDSELSDHIYWEDSLLTGIEEPIPGKVYRIAISEKGGVIKAFINGVMVVNKQKEGIEIKGKKLIRNRDGFRIICNGASPSDGTECLFTDIKLAGYKK